MTVLPLRQMVKKRKRAIRTRKRKFKCGEKGHYSNECDKEQPDDGKTVKTSNKTASNFLVTNDNQHGYSSDEDVSGGPYAECDFAEIQEANEENEESGEDTESESSDDQEKSSDESLADEDDDDKYEGFAFLHNDIVC